MPAAVPSLQVRRRGARPPVTVVGGRVDDVGGGVGVEVRLGVGPGRGAGGGRQQVADGLKQ
ncbi:hypothetical protein ACIF70_27045 [Actinacidiphila glaucinigra]|uniref:hypothetical protein n=1 Tax=Actinacidiphila glaucinigra TaxID=235986 RepID=UPI00370D4B53